MSCPSTSVSDLAQRLVADGLSRQGVQANDDLLLNDRLRRSLIRVAGVDGFCSLVARALAMTSEQYPALQNARVVPEGRIEGLEAVFADDPMLVQQAAIAVTTQLLELMVTFIGDSLTRRLVHESFRDPSTDE